MKRGRVKRTAILVLGMHRSGTSAFTRAFGLLGASFPRHLMPPARDNEKGYWESERLAGFNEGLLTEAGGRWDHWGALDGNCLTRVRRTELVDELAALIDTEFDPEDSLLLIKDPRICRLVPFYEQALGKLGVAPVFALTWRNPLAVAASLETRNGMTPAYAALLWLRHVLDAERASRGKPRYVASYEELMADRRGTLGRSAASLGIAWPRTLDAAAADIEEELPAGLQHHRATQEELQNAPGIADWVKAICSALPALPENEPETLAVFDRVKAEFDRHARLFGEASFPEFDRRLASLATARDHFEHATRRMESEVRRQAEEKEELDRRLGEQAAALERKDGELARLKATGDRLEAQRAALERDQAANAGLRRQFGETRGKLAASRIEVARLQADRASTPAGDAAGAPHAAAGLKNRLAAAIAWLPRTVLNAFVYWRLLAGCRVAMVALHDAEGSPVEGGGTGWAWTGTDPQLGIELPRGRALQPGHYDLTLHVMPGAASLAAARLYFDEGAGFQESKAFNLDFAGQDSGVRKAEFQLAHRVRGLRLDPCERPGRMGVRWTKLRRITRAEYYGRALVQLALHHVSAPRDVADFLRLARATLGRDGLSGLAATVRAARGRMLTGKTTYRDWIGRHEQHTEASLEKMRAELGALAAQPLVSVLMPVHNTAPRILAEAIESVRAQTYDNWELCIADDASSDAGTRRTLEGFAARDARIKVVYREENGHISRATNSAFELASGEWIALLDHDDVLSPDALGEMVVEINRHRDAEIIYSDEDKIDSRGLRYEPFFKPDYSRELFRSQNYFNHLTLHRAANIRSVGGWRAGFEGAQDYDLNLRIVERIDPASIRHVPKVLYHWRAEGGSTALAPSEKNYAYEAGMRALQEHMARTGLDGAVEPSPGAPFYRIRLNVPDPAPLVSLIIPTCDQLDLLRGCIDSIVALTDYDNYEIIVVDNRSRKRATLAYLEKLAETGVATVLPYDRPFNFSAINNFAVSRARGSIVGLINNDIEVISPGWLTEMVSWAALPDVGCVGGKLYFPDDSIQHAGVILGIGGVAGHSHKHFMRGEQGYFSRLKLVHNLSAVTAACLVVRKAVYEEVGGLEEEKLAVAFNDVDFCLKVREAGYVNVWTPHAELYHHESVSRGTDVEPVKAKRFRAEVEYMMKRWPLVPDPFYSPNLTLDAEDFSLAR